MARIILAEDDESLRDGLTLVLESFGHEVEAVADGGDVLNALSQEGADVIVTDLRMPRMNGLDLLRILREERRSIPVIIMSGTDKSRRAALFGVAREMGAKVLLAKPFKPEALLHAVDLCLRRRQDDLA